MKHRHQRGSLYKRSGRWYLRYSAHGKQASEPLTRGTKTEARRVADEFLRRVNDDGPQSSVTLKEFAEQTYLPAIEQQKRASTSNGYRNLWKRYFATDCDLKITLRAIGTADVERMLGAIAAKHELSRTTLGHIKAFLSGVFRYAKRQGILATENPVRDAAIPNAKPAKETYAYSAEETRQMLEILPEPAGTIVACAAFTGARKGELRGFRWENYDGREIKITEAWWLNTVAEPKTAKSKAPVPVIPQLAARLNLLRDQVGNPVSGLMFPAMQDSQIATDATKPVIPINLDALARDVIRPKLKANGLKWYGWHAFRRGLATNLHALGVQDKVIQRILRHSNVAVTLACYIKGTDREMDQAMEKLSAASA